MITGIERSEEIERQERFDRTEVDNFRTLLSNSIPDIEPLDFEEGRTLALRVRGGILPDGTLTEDAMKARNTMVFSCKGMVFNLAGIFGQSSDERDDLAQEGFITAYKAALDYDPDKQEKKAKFSSYAFKMIRFSMIRVAVKAQHYDEEHLLYEDLAQDPDEDRYPVEETIPDENALFRDSLDENTDANSFRKILTGCFRNSNLTEKQYAVLEARYVQGHTKSETGILLAQMFGKPLSPGSVADFEKKGLAKLKKSGAVEVIKRLVNTSKS
jgi:RNA polymerase sigma factor (sigma-70 family)